MTDDLFRLRIESTRRFEETLTTGSVGCHSDMRVTFRGIPREKFLQTGGEQSRETVDRLFDGHYPLLLSDLLETVPAIREGERAYTALPRGSYLVFDPMESDNHTGVAY